MEKPTFRGPPYKGEINPKTNRPYKDNPRAHGARWKAWYNKKTPDGRKQGEVWAEWTRSPEYKKSKDYINQKEQTKDIPPHTAQDQGDAVARAREQLKIYPPNPQSPENLAKEKQKQIERDKTKINPEDNWQNNPDFDQEKGGWQDRDKLINTLKIADKLNSARKLVTGISIPKLNSARKLVTGIVSGVGAVSSLLKIRP